MELAVHDVTGSRVNGGHRFDRRLVRRSAHTGYSPTAGVADRKMRGRNIFDPEFFCRSFFRREVSAFPWVIAERQAGHAELVAVECDRQNRGVGSSGLVGAPEPLGELICRGDGELSMRPLPSSAVSLFFREGGGRSERNTRTAVRKRGRRERQCLARFQLLCRTRLPPS